MNKQELIDILENLECSTESLSYDNGYEQGVYDSLSHVILLDEPKKVVVPKFVAEWIELYKKENKTTLWYVMNKIINEKFLNHQNIVIWFENDSNKNILEQAWVNGYEVEKEQLYYVKLPGVGYLNNADGGIKHTEQEIKTIDERYWPFAVKVDGE